MRRTVLTIVVSLAVGLLGGMLGERFLQAQPSPIKRTELLKQEIVEMAGKEGVLYIAELAPGAAAGKHTHPGPEFAYVLEGTLQLELEGQPPKTIKAGEAFHNPTKIVHDARNPSTTGSSKVLVFMLADKRAATGDSGALTTTPCRGERSFLLCTYPW